VRDSILLGLVLAVGTIFVFIADLQRDPGRRRRHPRGGGDSRALRSTPPG